MLARTAAECVRLNCIWWKALRAQWEEAKSVSAAPHSQAQCLPASHTLHICPSQMHIFLQEQEFSNTRHSLNFQREKTHPVEKQHFVAELWRSPSPIDRIFLGIYNIKRVHLNEAEHRRISESRRVCCCPELCCHLADTVDSIWNETVKNHGLTIPNKLLLYNLLKIICLEVIMKFLFRYNILQQFISTIHLKGVKA